jgi:nucleoside-diphosphate-sugar epimerase
MLNQSLYREAEMEMRHGDVCVVTGVSGYLGSWIARELLEQGYRVRGTVRSLKDPIRNHAISALLPGVELVAADLSSADGWAGAMDGAQWVFHVASPQAVKTETERTAKAVGGTAHVLAAACASPSVRKIVITSSEAAIAYGHARDKRAFDERDWSDVAGMKNGPGSDYFRSKTLAERLAWDWIADPVKNPRGVALSSVNPSLILGPSLVPWGRFSVEFLGNMVNGKMPLVPDMGVHVVDVRDCASMHIAVMRSGAANGRRHMSLALAGRMVDLPQALRRLGYKPSIRLAPMWLMRLLRLVSSDVASVYSHLGNRLRYTPRHPEVYEYRHTALDGIVRDTIDSMRAHGWIAPPPAGANPSAVAA